MKKITGGTAPAILWKDFMTAAHQNYTKGFSYEFDEPKKKLNNDKINRIIKKSKILIKEKISLTPY